jgi:hypothetical protein
MRGAMTQQLNQRMPVFHINRGDPETYGFRVEVIPQSDQYFKNPMAIILPVITYKEEITSDGHTVTLTFLASYARFT